MEDSMNLHEEKEAFSNAIRAASDHFGRREVLIEKDYWVTYILWKLSKSQYVDKVVFKGGTSLSKVFNLIDRFSEDVDLAVIKDSNQSSTQIRNLIRAVEKELTKGFKEIYIKGLTSKQTRYRKTAYDYFKVKKTKEDTGLNDSLVLEINSFSNPIPYEKHTVQSLIGEYLRNTENTESLKKYGLESFELNVLLPQSTLIEKILALIRMSYFKNGTDRIKAKVRHFYDIHFLSNSKEGIDFIASADFTKEFIRMYKEDKKKFADPETWHKTNFTEAPLLDSFDHFWEQSVPTYNNDFKFLVYGNFPDQKNVADSFKEIIRKLKSTDTV